MSGDCNKPKLKIVINPIPNQEKLGSDYGDWFIPIHLLNEQSICYCFGAGEDISFDIELIRHYGCHVYTFDPTPRSIEHVRLLINKTRHHQQTPINNDPNNYYNITSEDINKLHFYDFWYLARKC